MKITEVWLSFFSFQSHPQGSAFPVFTLVARNRAPENTRNKVPSRAAFLLLLWDGHSKDKIFLFQR